MPKKQLKHIDILEARKAYKEGRNITELLRFQKKEDLNTPEIIELAYDLQAGSYIEHTEKYPLQIDVYSDELAFILNRHITEADSLLDVGTGEFTTLSHVLGKLKSPPKEVFAFDISWSRIYMGLTYAKKQMGVNYNLLKPFVADMREIPLFDKSINITTSSHALETNGGSLEEILSELFRITIDKLVLFECCFEINSEEGKKRMERLGYIKNIDGAIEKLGGKLLEKIIIKNKSNALNPTVCFIVTPPPSAKEMLPNKTDIKSSLFSVPGTNIPLIKFKNYYFSNKLGLCYPTVEDIPLFTSNTAILASALCI